jgi:Tfp pilus assembly protein PilO
MKWNWKVACFIILLLLLAILVLKWMGYFQKDAWLEDPGEGNEPSRSATMASLKALYSDTDL